ncbi:TetR/AcrR family transcriptional regulator [Pseudomonas sp. QLc11A]|uniref:TetR/AcrR family transcriptional regulator n=1 Tax=Pseudomonas azerbaijanorientalis TaxID=2842350 RepID=A0ABW8W2R2_9PSED
MEASTQQEVRGVRRGRPSLEEAERLVDDILDRASLLFMEQGFGVTSVEAIAQAAGISKRTFYTRFAGKAEVFEAVVLRYVRRNVRSQPVSAAPDQPLEKRLYDMGIHLLEWILQPDVLGIYRMTIAEVQRFPQLAHMVAEYAVVDATRAFESTLRAHAKVQMNDEEIAFVAGQFMQTVAAEPFHRAIQGLESPGLDDGKRERLRRAVKLFLQGFPGD